MIRKQLDGWGGNGYDYPSRLCDEVILQKFSAWAVLHTLCVCKTKLEISQWDYYISRKKICWWDVRVTLNLLGKKSCRDNYKPFGFTTLDFAFTLVNILGWTHTHTQRKMCLILNSTADTSKDISLPCPLVLSWLCLHKFGGVYLRCQDQCWPQIDNFLGTCTLATYRSGHINLSHPPLPLDSTLLLTHTIHFFFLPLRNWWSLFTP